MYSVHAPGYSDFFTSGIRLVSRRLAMEGHVRSTSLPVPIPLSFDSGSDSESETEMTKRRTSRLVSNSKSHGDRDPSSDGKLDRKKRRRCSSLMSITHHLFRNRRHHISNDESGWLSSTSSNSSFEDSIDLINSSAWPECPNGGYVPPHPSQCQAETHEHRHILPCCLPRDYLWISMCIWDIASFQAHVPHRTRTRLGAV